MARAVASCSGVKIELSSPFLYISICKTPQLSVLRLHETRPILSRTHQITNDEAAVAVLDAVDLDERHLSLLRHRAKRNFHILEWEQQHLQASE